MLFSIMNEPRITTENLFDIISKELNHKTFLKHFPPGILFQGAYDDEKNLGKLILALALEYYEIQLLSEKYANEYDIRKTTEFLGDWENTVGLPSDCFNLVNKSLNARRVFVEEMFGNFKGAQTIQDFEDILERLKNAGIIGDFQVIVQQNGVNEFPMSFPLIFSGDLKTLSHTVIVILDATEDDYYFPYEFPLPFSEGTSIFVKCLFEILVPANVNVQIKLSS